MPRLTAIAVMGVLVALGTAGCDRSASDEGPLAPPVAEVPEPQDAPLEPPPAIDPLFGGSAPLGSGAGLALLDSWNDDRLFFRDFGNVRRGETRSWLIRMVNQDPRPVALRDVSGACTCLHVRSLLARTVEGEVVEGDRYVKEPPLLVAPPGAVVEIELELRTERLTPNSDKLAMLRVLTDSSASPYITFEAHVKVLDSFLVTPAEINLGDVAQSYGGRERARILVAPKGSPAKVLGVLEQGKRVQATFEETYFADELLWHINVELPPLEPLGAVRDQIVLRTTDENGNGDSERLVVPVIGQVVPDVRIKPNLVALGAVSPGTEAERLMTLEALVPGSRTKVVDHRFEGPSAPYLSLVATAVRPDDEGRSTSVELRVQLSGAHPPGAIDAELTVDLDDQQNPTASVPVRGVVR